MITAIYSIIIFLLVILIHEAGHFFAAKKSGINVEEFSIGMGPVIFKKEKEETTYYIKALPIGGYVKLEGEDDAIVSERSFNAKSIKTRLLIIFMGPFMNLFLAFIIFFVINLIYGVPGTKIEKIYESSNTELKLLQDDKIISVNGKKVFLWDEVIKGIEDSGDIYSVTVERDGQNKKLLLNKEYRYIIGITSRLYNGNTSNVIDYVTPGSPADKAGISAGEKIIEINGINIENWEDITTQISGSAGNEVNVKVLNKNNAEIEYKFFPDKQFIINFFPYSDKSLIIVLIGAFYRIVFYLSLLISVISGLIARTMSTEVIAGPVGIVSMVGEAARYGPYALMTIAGFININLGFFNLLPIPALDGSRIMFLVIEKIRGKRISEEKEKTVHLIGFILLLMLMAIVVYRDIIKLLG